MPMLVFRTLCLGLALFLLAGVSRVGGQASSAGESGNADQLRKLALEEGEAGKTDDAIRDYRRALELQPEWKEGWWNLGMLQYSSRRFSDAISTFQRVTAFAPKLGMAWSLLGLSEYETGNYEDAVAHLQKAQELGISEDEEIARVSAYHLGLLSIRESRFERASELLLANFGAGAIPPQAKTALGLATLRVPLLPQQLDPSREALVQAAGEAAAAGTDAAERFSALLKDHREIPYLHYAYGLALAQAGKTKDALDQVMAETKISPGSAIPWIEASRLQILQGKAADSIAAAQHAIRLSPSNPDAHRALAKAFDASGKSQRASKERQSFADLPSSEIVPEERIVSLYANGESNPDASQQSNQDRWNQALHEYVVADYAAAETDFKAWLVNNPDNGNGWALLGLCEFELKDTESALLHLDRSSKLGLSASTERMDEARYVYGILLVHAGRFEEAESVLATVHRANGPLLQKSEIPLGLALLRRAELPDNVSAQDSELIAAAGRIAALLELSKYDEAFPKFRQLLEQYPHTPFLHYAYGTALIALSEFDEAATQMQAERAISLRSELPCLRLASIALRQHDADIAIQHAQCALEMVHGSVDGHYLLGRAYLESGDVTSAVRELEAASELSPASPEIHFNLAKAYAKAKMPEKAQREREAFSRINDAQKSTQ